MESHHDKKKPCKCCPERKIPESPVIRIWSVRDLSWDKYIGEDVKDAKCPVCQTTIITKSDCKIVKHLENVTRSNGKIRNVARNMPVCKICAITKGTMDIIEFSNKYFGRNPLFPGLKELPVANMTLPSVKLNELTK